MANLRRSARASSSKVSYSDEFSPSYPDNEPVNGFERCVASLDQQSFPWRQFSAVDDVLVYSLFSSKRRTNGYRAIKTERVFGEEDAPVTAEKGIAIRNIVRKYLPELGMRNTQDFEKAALALVKALPELFLQEQISIVEHLLHRYDILYSADSPVVLEKVSFDRRKVCLGLRALRNIPAGCPILSTSTSLSQDVVPEKMIGISVIEASRGQKGPMGARLMLGPLRFANHDCKPNCQIRSIAGSYAYVLWSIQGIEMGSSITVGYTKDAYYFDGRCACASCCPDSPPTVIHRPISAQGVASEVEKQPNHKRKQDRAGKRKRRRIRRREAGDRELEAGGGGLFGEGAAEEWVAMPLS